MTQLQKDIKRYLKEVDKSLFGSRKDREKFLAQYEKSIYENMKETRREYDYEQLVLYFGSPATIAANYAYAFEPEVNDAKRKNKKKLRMVSFICTLVMIVCFILVMYMAVDTILHYTECYMGDTTYFSR